MSRGATYLALLAALRQQELSGEARRRQRTTTEDRRLNEGSLPDPLRRIFGAPHQ
jgi:hypothetical protein